MNNFRSPEAPNLTQRLARYSRRHHRGVFVATLLLLGLCAVLISRLRFDTDVSNLLPRNDRTLNAYLQTLSDFGTLDYLLTTIAIPEGQVVDPYTIYADALAARFAAIPELESVEYRIEEPEQLVERFLPDSLLFLDQADRGRLVERLSASGIRARVAQLRRLLSTPQSLALADLARVDPLGLAEIFIGRIANSRGAMAIDWMSGYYLSEDQRLLLVLSKPRSPPYDVEFDRAMLSRVEEAIAATNAEWPGLVGPGDPQRVGPGDPQPPLPRVRVGGAHVSARADETLIKRDIALNSTTSLVLVLLLFFYAFRRLSTLVYAFLPLIVGMVLTFAFAYLLFGVVSSATSGTAALLMGLGIDFVIVAYGRFVDESARGHDFEHALDIVMGTCARGVVVGAVTTAASFFAFTFTDFRGLSQMGILTGMGILFCLAAVIVLLPAMLGWSESHHLRRATQPNLYLHSFGVDRVIRACFRHPWPVLAAGALLTIVFGGLALQLQFNDNWRALRPAGSEGMAVEEEVQRHFRSDFEYMMLIVTGPDLESVLERTERATVDARELVAEGVLSAVTSATTLIPPARRQQEAITWVEEGRRLGALDPERIRADFAAALEAEGLRYEPFARGVELLSRALVPAQPIELANVAEDAPAGQALIGRLLKQQSDGTWRSVLQLHPPADRWRRDAPPQALALAAETDAILTGSNLMNKVVRERVRRDAWIGLAIGTALVFLIVLADFRDLGLALFCQVPLFVGVLWMLGAMALFGLQFNFMNIFVTTMILGVAVDYGLHIMHRFREARRTGEDLMTALSETGNAVLLAALASIAAFGSLAISSYPGVRSTGYVATLGSLANVVVSLTVLPAFLALWVRRAARS